MKKLLPLCALLLTACQTTPPPNSLAIDDADAWQAIWSWVQSLGGVFSNMLLH